MDFLSDRNRRMHAEYLENLGCKFSIFEKSYPELCDKDLRGILRCKIPRAERDLAFSLKCEIIAHQIYFSSFSESGEVSKIVKKKYGSEAAFLYMLYEKCNEAEGFLFIYVNKSKEPDFYIGKEYGDILLKCKPCLAVDLFEHAYFYDYGFDKSSYLKQALSSLSLSKLNSFN